MQKTIIWVFVGIIIVIGGYALLNGDKKSSSPRKETHSFLPTGQADKDCSNFITQREAQAFFEVNGGPDSDPHNLDRDKDGKVCESLK